MSTACMLLYAAGALLAEGLRRAHCARHVRDWGTQRDGVRSERVVLLSLVLGVYLLPLVYALTPWLGFADHAPPSALAIVGTVVFALGLVLRWGVMPIWGITMPRRPRCMASTVWSHRESVPTCAIRDMPRSGSEGWRTFHVPVIAQDTRRRVPPFQHMPAIYLAGLGTLGLNCCVLTPEFGPRAFCRASHRRAPAGLEPYALLGIHPALPERR